MSPSLYWSILSNSTLSPVNISYIDCSCPKYTYSSTVFMTLPLTLIYFGWTNWLNIHLVLLSFILSPTLILASLSSSNLGSSSSGLHATSIMSSAKCRWLKLSNNPYSQSIVLKTSSSNAVKSFGDMVSPCRTPLLMFIWSLSLCNLIVDVSSFLHIFSIYSM